MQITNNINKEQQVQNKSYSLTREMSCMLTDFPWFSRPQKQKHWLLWPLSRSETPIHHRSVHIPKFIFDRRHFNICCSVIFYWWTACTHRPRGIHLHNRYVNSKPINFSEFLVWNASWISEAILHFCPLWIKRWIGENKPGLTFRPPVIS